MNNISCFEAVYNSAWGSAIAKIRACVQSDAQERVYRCMGDTSMLIELRLSFIIEDEIKGAS